MWPQRSHDQQPDLRFDCTRVPSDSLRGTASSRSLFLIFIMIGMKMQRTIASVICTISISHAYVCNVRQQLCWPLQSARAGEDGYSVLRQPADWKLEEDPVFETPKSLEDDDKVRMALDSEWWGKGTTMRDEMPKSEQLTKEEAVAPATEDFEQTLDLLQRSIETLDFPFIMRALEEECTTMPGRMLARAATKTTPDPRKEQRSPSQRAFQPFLASSLAGCQERYRAVEEMQWILQGGRGVDKLNGFKFKNRRGSKQDLSGRPPPLDGNSFDIMELLHDSSRVLEGHELLQVLVTLNIMENVCLWGEGLRKVDSIEFVELPRIVDDIAVNGTLQDLLYNAFDNDEKLSGTTFPAIGRLRATVRNAKADIMKSLDEMLSSNSLKSKLSTDSGGALISQVEGGRLVIPIDTKHASSVGIIHDTSRSGKTAYVEPTGIIGPTNELRQVENELREEEARVWRSLTEEVLRNMPSIEASVSAVGQLDAVLSRLMLGRTLSGVIPDVKNEGIISLQDAKHPVLILRNKDVVGSDVELGVDGNQGLVLTGPNSGGKTIIMKLLGLVAMMTRGGIPIPAKNSQEEPARVDFFDPVLTDIGDMQSVDGDLSTFSGHMLVCREVLANSGENALVLMDELGSGTDPAQGVAIAQALLEAILETGSRVAITTHYMQLKQLATTDERFAVAGMQFVKGRPTYRLQRGAIGESFALSVAERLNLPASVLQRANELLDSETRLMGDIISELEDQKVGLDEQTIELEEQKKELGRMKFKLKEEQIRLENKVLTARRDEARKFAKKLEEKESILETILDRLKADPSKRVVAKSWDDVKFVKRDAINEAEYTPAVVAKKRQEVAVQIAEQAELVPLTEMREKPKLNAGDSLIVCKRGPMFGKEGKVVQASGARVELNVNRMIVSFKLAEVALPNGKVSGSDNSVKNDKQQRQASRMRAAEKAIAAERSAGADDWTVASGPAASSSVAMRTDSNTVDVRGCNSREAQDLAKQKFSSCLLNGQSTVYILHGHGTGGILKSNVRKWLKSEKQLVKRWLPADASDGGDAFTRVELQ